MLDEHITDELAAAISLLKRNGFNVVRAGKVRTMQSAESVSMLTLQRLDANDTSAFARHITSSLGHAMGRFIVENQAAKFTERSNGDDMTYTAACEVIVPGGLVLDFPSLGLGGRSNG